MATQQLTARLAPRAAPLSQTDVRLEVFDAQGRLVRAFRSREPAGRRRLEWDLADSRGQLVPAGVYTYRMRAGAFEARRKMVVLP